MGLLCLIFPRVVLAHRLKIKEAHTIFSNQITAFQRETQGIKKNQNYICDRTRIRT